MTVKPTVFNNNKYKIKITLESDNLVSLSVIKFILINRLVTSKICSLDYISNSVPVKTINLYTLLRSPHVNKKSREQFKTKTYKQSIIIPTNNLKLFLEVLKEIKHSKKERGNISTKIIINK